MPEEAGITEEQAYEALQQLSGTSPEESGIPQPEPVVEAEPSQEAEPAEQAEETSVEEVHEDDLASLQSRTKELEQKLADSEASAAERLEAIQRRTLENEKIFREKYLRKSTAADQALRALEGARSQEGISEEDVARVISEIKGTMNPASPSYVEPTVAEQTLPPDAYGDHRVIANNFMIEKGMNAKDEADFSDWIRNKAESVMSAGDQALAHRGDIDGFLRLAHPVWNAMREQEKQETRDDAIGAVKSVQRTQRKAAQAASVSTSAPKKQPAGAAAEEYDVSNLTPDDVSTLIRQSVTQYHD
jgi:hypothetical protein